MKAVVYKWKNVPLTVKVSMAYMICSIIQKCITFITLPLFTRLLTTAQYGQYTIYQSWLGMLTIFITLNLAYGSFSTAMVKFEKDRYQYIASIQGICLLQLFIFLCIYLPFQGTWNTLFELPTSIVLIMALQIIAETSVLLWSGKKRFEFKYVEVVVITLLISVLGSLVAFFLVSHYEEKGFARIVGYASVSIIIGGCVFFSNLCKGKRLYDKRFWKYALKFNIPLLIYYLSQVIFNQSDRIMISHITGKSDAAMYGVAYSLAIVLQFVLNAINNAYLPWFYERLKSNHEYENKVVSNTIAIIMTFLLLGVIWYAPEIILLMAGHQYSVAIYVVAPVSMSLLLLFYAQLFINVEFYYEQKRFLVWASIGAAALNILLNYLLIPILGFVAAGYTTLASYFVFALCNYFAMKKILNIIDKKDSMYDYKVLLWNLVAFIIIAFVGVALYDMLALRIVITVAVLFISFVLGRKRINILLTIWNDKQKDSERPMC